MVQRSMAASPLGGGGNDTRLRQVTDRSGNCRGAACCAPTSTTLGRDRPRSRRVLLRPQRRTPCRRRGGGREPPVRGAARGTGGTAHRGAARRARRAAGAPCRPGERRPVRGGGG